MSAHFMNSNRRQSEIQLINFRTAPPSIEGWRGAKALKAD
jgi:hypothetical protein